jgi:hypothetical protein
MAVVTKSATTLPDLMAANPSAPPVTIEHGRVRRSMHAVAVANGDSAASTLELARIPSHAVILPMTTLHHSAVTGATDNDLGFDNDPDALIDGATIASAGTKPGMSAVALADKAKRAWELAGLTADPKEKLPIKLTLNSAATADGLVALELFYIVD